MAKNTILKIILGLEDKASSGLKKFSDGIGNIKSKLGDLTDAGKKALDIFFAPLKTVAVPAIGAVTAAFGLAVKAMKDWAGQELGERDIISALIAMGQYTDQYKDKLVGLANTYQESTGIADDYWLKSLGQLTRFGMNSENVDKVSEALKNLTGLMDGNIDTATDALAKALQGEFSMFSRFGIIVETSGDKIKDLDKLIQGINQKGTGLLEARADTLSGKFQALKNTISDMSEAAGKRLADGLDIGSAIETAKGKFATLMANIQNGGLGDILEKAGEALRAKIDAAVKWAEKIAEAVEKSGKPLDQVFSDALRAAAKVFVDTLGTLLTAGLEIWKAIGVVIFDTLEERALASDWLKGVAVRKANKNYDSATPEQKQVWTDWRTKNPNATSHEFAAHVASGNSDDAVATALTNAMTGIKTAFDGLLEKAKTAVEESVGLKTDTTAATPEKSMITIHGSDGEEITMALDEYIKQLSAQNDKQAEAANAGTDALSTRLDMIRCFLLQIIGLTTFPFSNVRIEVFMMKNAKQRAGLPFIFIGVAFLPALSAIAVKTDGWYQTLGKPVWNPPPYLFGPVWTLLYILIGFAGYFAWTCSSRAARIPAFTVYGLQLFLNALWTPLFFGLHRPGWALIDLALLWFLILLNIGLFCQRSRLSAGLLIPYFLWVSFAGALNAAIWRLN